MRELLRIPRIGLPALTRRTVSLALAGIVVLAVVITPGVSSALKVFTFQKASKISLGNTRTVTQAGIVVNPVTGVDIMCPAKHQATSGGADSPSLAGTDPGGFPWLIVSAPITSGAKSVGWHLEILNQGSPTPHQFTAYAVCAP
jgi:hypothetical protein